MKRLSITKGFLAIIIICSILLGSAVSYVLLDKNLLDTISGRDKVTIDSSKYQELSYMYNKYSEAEELWNVISDYYYTDFDDSDVQEGMLSGIVSGLGDKYSAYYTAEEYEEIEASLTGEYSGVGITMSVSGNYVQVVGVTRNSPAESGGVTEGEYIVAVDGTEYSAEEMDTLAAAIRGPEGTSVTVTFIKDGEYIDRSFVRTKIFTETVEYEILDDNIGYIWLYGFESASYDDFVEALDALKNTDGLILDLRSNLGGLVDQAQDIADLFLDKATLYYTEDSDGVRDYFYTKNGTGWDKPLTLIIDENTASASEILASGLKDNGRCKLVGTLSFGKGIIQSFRNLSDGSVVKLTMWQYFSPNGNAIHQIGVSPDYEVELDDSCFDEEGYLIEDKQLEKAVEVIKSEINK